jgi:hypothetical protein
MEMPQENSLAAILSKNVIIFSFANQRTREWNKSGGRGVQGKAGTTKRGEEVAKGCNMVNMVQTLCTHVCKWKNDTC